MSDAHQYAVVLGAGGHAASAWEIGVLTGLAEGGIDVRHADRFVGTSAGARVAIQLLTAPTVEDLFRAEVDAGRPNEEELPSSFEPQAWRDALARAREATDLHEGLRRLGELPAAASTDELRRERIGRLLGHAPWPREDVLLAAVDADAGERVALARASGIDVVDAVMASGAVPGIWPLPRIHGHRYLDGGTYSIDNVDLAVGCDRILVLTLRPRTPPICAVSLEEGLSKVRREGAHIEVILPDEAAEAAFASVGHNVFDPAVRQKAADAGRAQGRALASSLDWLPKPERGRASGAERFDHYTRILARDARPGEALLDGIYEQFAHSDPFLPVTHFVDHATMGPEALIGLGLGDRAPEWVARHHPRPYRAPLMGVQMASTWPSALGRPECHGDWLLHFERELGGGRYEDVVARWVPRFAHDVGALLFHGLIRTAHAVRALDYLDTPTRRAELARGLALWASAVKAPQPSFVGGPEPEPFEAEIARFARAGAAAFICDPSIPNVHLVTGPMAYLLLAHHVGADAHRVAIESYRGTHARALASLAETEPEARTASVPPLDDRQLEHLVRQRDAHPAKLTEAALRAYARTSDDLFLRAAGRMHDSTAFERAFRTARAVVLGW